MSSLTTISENKAFGGVQGVYSHASAETKTDMTFAVFVPGREDGVKLPVLWYLSGLTCTHANVMDKGEYRRLASELGLIIVCPDTSPRGEGVPDDEAYDMGQGAGFYVNATEEPWAANFRMRSYIEQELPALIAQQFPADMERQGIFGHSMGGHGALTIGLRNPDRFKSVSAFAPIVSSLNCPWGHKALGGYLGTDQSTWRDYDACALIEDGARVANILVDQGTADQFLEEQLKPDLLVAACERAAIPLTLNMREGYDHSYFTISTFMDDHLRWHAERL
ncbi:S-formylglutathione hydrolase [Parasphingorhabdus cellanae]|uniref:S-formylglutathione hydrolase n=2 Tax=Parasphingorhabdus cellanae TaxID=2806553 RepID=A0ABX7T8G3_9SPHN|nr:S-formylglutathione hydrolase [Parasphingorhabdus cellanae]